MGNAKGKKDGQFQTDTKIWAMKRTSRIWAMIAKAPGGCFPSHLHLSLLLVLVQTRHPLSKYDGDDGYDRDDGDDHDSGDDDDGDDNIFIMATWFTSTILWGSPHLWHGHSWDVPQMSEIRSIPDIYGILILHDFEAS